MPRSLQPFSQAQPFPQSSAKGLGNPFSIFTTHSANAWYGEKEGDDLGQ